MIMCAEALAASAEMAMTLENMLRFERLYKLGIFWKSLDLLSEIGIEVSVVVRSAGLLVVFGLWCVRLVLRRYTAIEKNVICHWQDIKHKKE
jgi:hypothetical protein